MPGCAQVPDAQPAMDQANVRSAIHAFVIRSPIPHVSGHGREKGFLALEEFCTVKTVVQYHGQ